MRIAIHRPTGRTCKVLNIAGARAFCDFGDHPNPFTWVNLDELQFQS